MEMERKEFIKKFEKAMFYKKKLLPYVFVKGRYLVGIDDTKTMLSVVELPEEIGETCVDVDAIDYLKKMTSDVIRIRKEGDAILFEGEDERVKVPEISEDLSLKFDIDESDIDVHIENFPKFFIYADIKPFKIPDDLVLETKDRNIIFTTDDSLIKYEKIFKGHEIDGEIKEVRLKFDKERLKVIEKSSDDIIRIYVNEVSIKVKTSDVVYIILGESLE